ncbi:EAL domain-containing protein [Piscinibacter sakaiensis]|uniref:Diguanylate cyclase/phosphodiesterase with PAS/PAC sensor(S) n=1 Tax=Piscinibacter sakaiensis TaxID=1547922 RepID=A0A0K8NZ98_PISS1|nr:EAL domain-containing protein [Piscinibacter sakaiensis]GAP35722.1 diguanylate cyclase/phosphodiesterase with PAS/PAC sensor(s) [Piscinibacter sakaiensis]
MSTSSPDAADTAAASVLPAVVLPRVGGGQDAANEAQGPVWAWGWTAFRRRHLYDYNAAATRFWLLMVGAGGLALAVSLVDLAAAPLGELLQVAAWCVLVAVAAAFPIEIPRSRHSIAVGDVLIFLTLALHGAAAAVLAAAVEGGVAAMRGSSRVSSRIGTLAAGALGMAVAGMACEAAGAGFAALGLGTATAEFAALVVAALAYFPAHTLPQMQVFSLKRGSSLRLREWFHEGSWVGTLYLLSGLVAGVLSLNAQVFGRSVVVVAVLAIGAALAMLRAHFQRESAEHAQQEARLAAAEAASRQNQQRFEAAFSHAAIGMAIVSGDGQVMQVNQAICALLGAPAAQLLQRSFRGIWHPGDADMLARRVDAMQATGDEGFSIELRCHGPEGREIWVSLHCAPFDDRAGLQGLIFQLHDISSRRRAEGELHHIAYHDSLTDLANRNCFHERLQLAVERSRRDAGHRFAVMYLDLDRFKVVNDSLGHPAGDELLKEVGRRLAAHTRDDDLVARLGGDEFAILLHSTTDEAEVLRLGERLLGVLDRPVRICGTELRPLASIGITFSGQGDREPDDVLRDADLAMYQAKAGGKGRLAMFDPSLHDQLGHRLQLEADLRRAIGAGQLTLAYQPLYDLEPYRLSGFEALTRWIHPSHGPVSPAVFIALAEETGCIEALTAWAIDEASRQLAQWRREVPQYADLVMHVNVSGKDLSRPQFVPRVREVLARHGLPARLLTLEITESTLMEQRELALQSLGELRALGVRLGIDDFGTGYSSLAYLSTLPFDCLKIDRSFVMGMDQSPQNLEIVRTVVSLGRTLNKHVVAEGIETPAQLQMLKTLGATIGQGYLLARPLHASQVEHLLRAPGLEAA